MITVICEKIGGFVGGPGSSAIALAAGSVDIWATAKLQRSARATGRSSKHRLIRIFMLRRDEGTHNSELAVVTKAFTLIEIPAELVWSGSMSVMGCYAN